MMMTKKKSVELSGPTLPGTVYLACSGGVDSMFALDFLLRGGRQVTLAYFHHRTETGEQALSFLRDVVLDRYNVGMVTGNLTSKSKPAGKSQEEHWRDERYKFLHGVPGSVVMAHHLDDCLETWLFSAMHGTPKVIPYRNRNVIRPFLLARKEYLINWCERHDVPWIEDQSNEDTRYMRNRIRHKVVPEALKINPGLHKVVARQVKKAGAQ